MKHHKKARKLRKGQQRAAKKLESDYRSLSELHPIHDPESRPEPTVEDMLRSGEGNLSDR